VETADGSLVVTVADRPAEQVFAEGETVAIRPPARPVALVADA
jgi:hypothetical protein